LRQLRLLRQERESDQRGKPPTAGRSCRGGGRREANRALVVRTNSITHQPAPGNIRDAAHRGLLQLERHTVLKSGGVPHPSEVIGVSVAPELPLVGGMTAAQAEGPTPFPGAKKKSRRGCGWFPAE
jgi:hypothetical protein